MLFALLVAPDLHYQADRQEFDGSHLHSHREAQDGNLLAFAQVFHGLVDNFLRSVESVVVLDGVIVHCGIEEFRLDPAGSHRHYVDALSFQLNTEGSGEIHNEGL